MESDSSNILQTIFRAVKEKANDIWNALQSPINRYQKVARVREEITGALKSDGALVGEDGQQLIPPEISDVSKGLTDFWQSLDLPTPSQQLADQVVSVAAGEIHKTLTRVKHTMD